METKRTTRPNWYAQKVILFEESRFGAMTLMMTSQSCLGSVAAMLILKAGHLPALSLGIAVTLASNAAFIAQSPAKWCVNLFSLSVVVNIMLIVTYAFYNLV